jgi:hypothetical protein
LEIDTTGLVGIDTTGFSAMWDSYARASYGAMARHAMSLRPEMNEAPGAVQCRRLGGRRENRPSPAEGEQRIDLGGPAPWAARGGDHRDRSFVVETREVDVPQSTVEECRGERAGVRDLWSR